MGFGVVSHGERVGVGGLDSLGLEASSCGIVYAIAGGVLRSG